MNEAAFIEQIAARHDVPQEAVAEALKALRRGNGTMAQFSHEAFGGMAQWSKGGMSMVGDMFNRATKARLDAVMADLADGLATGVDASESADRPDTAVHSTAAKWPTDFGAPASSGSQNDMAYAFFPSSRRLIIDSDRGRKIYDTGDHQITGVSQQQSGAQSLRFTSPDGDVSVETLKAVE
jgi:hypothetical protein